MNNSVVVNEFPSNQIVSLFKHATIWDCYSTALGFIQLLTETSNRNLTAGGGGIRRGSSTSHSPTGLHDLLQG
jgi:hypothetical protein